MSYAGIHHVAINVAEFDWYQKFFEEVLQMTVKRVKGEAPKRQLWFWEGIQLKEVPENGANGETVDHVALGTANVEEIVQNACARGCSRYEKGDHWFILPNGVKVELMKEEASGQ